MDKMLHKNLLVAFSQRKPLKSPLIGRASGDFGKHKKRGLSSFKARGLENVIPHVRRDLTSFCLLDLSGHNIKFHKIV